MKQSGQEDAGKAGEQCEPRMQIHMCCKEEKSSNQEAEAAGNEIDHR